MSNHLETANVATPDDGVKKIEKAPGYHRLENAQDLLV
jgi:hypothetical protein